MNQSNSQQHNTIKQSTSQKTSNHTIKQSNNHTTQTIKPSTKADNLTSNTHKRSRPQTHDHTRNQTAT